MKSKRHMKIMEIVEACDIETQEDLITHLHNAGYDVTQATVSRDIRELKLAKVMCETGTYKYIVPQSIADDGHHVYNKALTASIRTVNHACNIVVVRTYPGMANAVAAGIDAIKTEYILGCVAGDDTIMIVAQDEAAAGNVEEQLKKIIVE